MNFLNRYFFSGKKEDLEIFVDQISKLGINTLGSIVQNILQKTTDSIFCTGIFNMPELVKRSDGTYIVRFEIISNFNVANINSFEKLIDELKVRYELNVDHMLHEILEKIK